MKKIILIIGGIIIITILGRLSWAYLQIKNSGENATLQTVQHVDSTPKQLLGDSEAVAKIDKDYSNYGNDARIVFKDINRIWFAPPHETEGCNFLKYLDLIDGQYWDSDISACSKIDFEQSNPLYILDCSSFAAHCSDFVSLKAVDLRKKEDVTLVENLNAGETLIDECFDGNYGQECTTDISMIDKNILRVRIFQTKATSSVFYKNKKIREEIIDLTNFY